MKKMLSIYYIKYTLHSNNLNLYKNNISKYVQGLSKFNNFNRNLEAK